MKILLTGTAGFIGSHVAHRLLDEGKQVVGVDNFNEYYDVRLKRFRSQALESRDGFQLYKTDLSDKIATLALFEEVAPDVVIHLAAQAGVRYSLVNPHAYTEANVEAFLNVLEGCRNNKTKRLVYASSSSVYGGIKQMPFREDMAVDKPISLYAATKKANELMAHTYTHLYGFETVGLRFFTVYGPCGRPDMAMWLFSDAILNNRPIKVFNNGKMRRDFTYVDDIVSGVVSSMTSAIPEPARIYNLGNHKSENLEELIEILEISLGKKAEKQYLPIQPGDVPDTFANIERAHSELGYCPTTSIHKGIPAFVNWYRNEWLPFIESNPEA